MATIEISINVSNISTVIATYNRILVYRSLTQSGVYTEVSTSVTRPVLQSGITDYLFTDESAPADLCWYRVSYYHTSTLVESAQLTPFRGYATYITVADIRSEGISTSELSDSRALTLILGWQKWLEKACGQFFTNKELTVDFDGDGSRLLQLPLPIITCSALYINDDFTNAIDTSEYVVYNSRGPVNDDRRNPRIKLKRIASIYSSIYSLSGGSSCFAMGDRNVRVIGTWGYTESDDTTPEPVKRALMILVLAAKELLGDDDLDQLKVGRVIEEVTDRHRISYADLYDRMQAWNPTGFTEVDLVLRMYRAPQYVGAARNI
jgi:hypothetical protein